MVSTLPDAASHPQPDVRQQFFADIDTRRPTEVSSAIQSLRLTNAQIPAMLHTMVKSLLGKVRCCVADSYTKHLAFCGRAVSADTQHRSQTVISKRSHACERCVLSRSVL